MAGWIKIHRDIFEHWVSQDPIKFRWWIIMLSEVNYEDNKAVIGVSLYDIPTGSRAYSLRTWADKFGCGVKAVVSFFNLLESDGMIERKIIGKGQQSTTLINIINYSRYQVLEETQTELKTDSIIAIKRKSKRHTVKEVKEIKEIKKDIYLDSDKDVFEDFIETFNMILGKNFQVTESVFSKFKARLKDGYTQTQMLEALENAKTQKHHIETNFKYLTPEFFTRPDKIELYKNHE